VEEEWGDVQVTSPGDFQTIRSEGDLLPADLLRRASPHRQRRERKAHVGELVHLDGSSEAWLEDRAQRACLMSLVDDATGRCGGRFEGQETFWGAVRSVRGWIATCGIAPVHGPVPSAPDVTRTWEAATPAASSRE